MLPSPPSQAVLFLNISIEKISRLHHDRRYRVHPTFLDMQKNFPPTVYRRQEVWTIYGYCLSDTGRELKAPFVPVPGIAWVSGPDVS